MAISDTVKHVAVGDKEGRLSVLSFNEATLSFTSSHQIGVSSVNYVRTTATGKTFVLRPERLTVLDSKALKEGKQKTLLEIPSYTDPTAIEVSESEKIIYTAHWSDNLLSVKFLEDQKVSYSQDINCGWAHQFRPHPNGKWAYAACMKNLLKQFSIKSSETGMLEMAGPDISIKGGPRHIEFHTDGTTLYVLLQISSQIAVFDIDMETGELMQPAKQIIHSTRDHSKSKSSDLHVTPNGKWLYAFNRKNQNMAVFRVLTDRTLKLEMLVPMNKGEVRDWVMSEDGTYLISASDQGHVGLWAINNKHGALTLKDELLGHGNFITAAILD